MRVSRALAPFALAALLLAAAGARADKSTHERHFQHFEGTKTCLQCHEEQAREVFASQHYQWQGSGDGLVNDPRHPVGKMNMINDFCTNPVASWIGQVKNPDGKVVATGCSNCHAGHGARPSTRLSRAQLENIDCLMCHAEGYKRTVVQNEKGVWEWRPLLWNNPEGLDSVSKRISTPTRVMCLRCHNASGGGANAKRGDLEYTLAKPTRDFDVHMGTDGKDMPCTNCHAEGRHRVIGRGVDLASNDSPGKRLGCAGECHPAAPHRTARLNKHAERIECTTCHVPKFARDEPTEMARDWSNVVYNREREKYSPQQVWEKDVTPVYAWYNGKSWMQLARQPVGLTSAGEIKSAVPMGSRADPTAKIAPFKLHRGRMPVTADQRHWLLPIAVEDCFGAGNVDEAVKKAAKAFYGIEDVKYEWLPTVRYMTIAHGVQPSENALGCDDCHSSGGRMDWKALGYDGDPREAAKRKAVTAGN